MTSIPADRVGLPLSSLVNEGVGPIAPHVGRLCRRSAKILDRWMETLMLNPVLDEMKHLEIA